jgi:hypothetical protein
LLKNEAKEMLIVYLVLLLIFLPVRILFVRYVSDNWFGSFGLISAFSISLVILAKKDKLGKFGKMFVRQMFKIHKGKRRYFVYTGLGLSTIVLAVFILSIETAKAHYQTEVNELLSLLPADLGQPNQPQKESLDSLANKLSQLTPEKVFLSTISMLALPVVNFKLYSIVMGALHIITEGWFLHFATVLLVENLEVIGILGFTKWIIKESDT